MNISDEERAPRVVPLSLDGSEALTFDTGGQSGWARFHSPEAGRAGLTLFLRFGPEGTAQDAPLQVRELYVAADSEAAFSSPLLRTLPFARMVAAVNRRTVRDELRRYMLPANVVQILRVGLSPGWRMELVDPVPAERPNLEIEVPADRRRPDEFYALVADTYLAQATLSTHAAQDLADANGVPRSTVHRWLKEARSRGLLRLPQQIDASNRSETER